MNRDNAMFLAEKLVKVVKSCVTHEQQRIAYKYCVLAGPVLAKFDLVYLVQEPLLQLDYVMYKNGGVVYYSRKEVRL